MNRMQQYIDEQPQILSALVSRRSAVAAPVVARLRDADLRRLILFGSGSSYHAAVMAAPILSRALGIEATACVPTRLSDLAGLDPQGTAYIAISQGGRSTNTYDLIGALQAQGIPAVAVTESNDTPVAQRADCAVDLPIGPEDIGAKTKGVSATAVTLMLIGLELGRARGTADAAWYAEIIAGLTRLADGMAENIARSKAWCELVCPALAPAQYLTVLAKGPARGGALEGALKLLETIYRPVTPYEFEEYLHGVQNALDGAGSFLCIQPLDEDGARMRRLVDFVESHGVRCFVVTEEAAAARGAQDLVLQSPGCPMLQSLTVLPALQTLSAQLSAHCGIDTTKRRYPDFFAMMASKLE